MQIYKVLFHEREKKYNFVQNFTHNVIIKMSVEKIFVF